MIQAHLFGVLEVIKERVLAPDDPLIHVGSGIQESVCLTGLASKDTMMDKWYIVSSDSDPPFERKNLPVEVRPDLMRFAST